MSKYSSGGLGAVSFLAVALLIVAAVGGWIANLVKLFGMFDGPVTTMFIGRIVGVFAAPIGSVLGFL